MRRSDRELVEGAAERAEGLARIAAKYSGTDAPIPPEQAARVAVIAIEVERVTGKASPRP